MRWHLLLLAWVPAWLVPLWALAAPAISVVDDSGQTLRLTEPARRIVSLAPHLTEMLFAIGAGDRIVGVVAHSDYPAAARRLPQIGGYNALDLERILALAPDLVVAWQSGNNPAQIDRLRQLGLTVFVNEPRRLQDIPRTAQRLALLTGRAQAGAGFARRFTQRLEALRRQYAARRPVRMFYQIWNQPLITVNGQHLISDVMRLCGAVNVFADLPVLAPTVSVEAVLLAAPELIVIGGDEKTHHAWREAWLRWPQLPAVRQGQIYFINPDWMQRHGPRILDGAEQLCRYVQQTRDVVIGDGDGDGDE